MIQSKQPPFGPSIDHSSVPLETMVMVMNVELVSPESKQPELPGFGLDDGLDGVPEPKSKLLVNGFGG